MKLKRLASFASAFLLTISSLMVFAPLAHAATATWDGGGGDGDFSNNVNWAGDVAPINGADLVFPAASTSVLLDNDSLASINSITIQDGSANGSYNIGNDNPVTVGNISVGAKQGLTFGGDDVTFASTSAISLSTTAGFVTIGDSSHNVALGANTLNVSSALTVTDDSSSADLPTLSISGALTGTSGSVVHGSKVKIDLNTASPSFNGEIQLSDSVLNVSAASQLGTATKGIVAVHSRVEVAGSSPVTIADPLSFDGNLFNRKTDLIGFEAVYGDTSDSGGTPGTTLSGAVTLLSDVAFDPFVGSIKITGALAGQFLIGASAAYPDGRFLTVASSANTSLVGNGQYAIIESTKTLSDSQPSVDLILTANASVTVDGKRGNVIVAAGGELLGHGTVGSAHFLPTSHLAPGNSPGCINTGNLVMDNTSNLEEQIGGTTECTEYDQTKVTGSVTLNNPNINVEIVNGFKPKSGNVFKVIDNDGTDPVAGSGTFNGIAEGGTVTSGSYSFKVSYVGGDGNDVTLSVIGTPNTGFELVTQNPIATFATTTVLAGALIVLSRRMRHVTSAR